MRVMKYERPSGLRAMCLDAQDGFPPPPLAQSDSPSTGIAPRSAKLAALRHAKKMERLGAQLERGRSTFQRNRLAKDGTERLQHFLSCSLNDYGKAFRDLEAFPPIAARKLGAEEALPFIFERVLEPVLQDTARTSAEDALDTLQTVGTISLTKDGPPLSELPEARPYFESLRAKLTPAHPPTMLDPQSVSANLLRDDLSSSSPKSSP
jgi:hypothetical protein